MAPARATAPTRATQGYGTQSYSQAQPYQDAQPYPEAQQSYPGYQDAQPYPEAQQSYAQGYDDQGYAAPGRAEQVYPGAEYQPGGGQPDAGAQYGQPPPTAGYPAGTGVRAPLPAPVETQSAQPGDRYQTAYSEQPGYAENGGYPEAAPAAAYQNGNGYQGNGTGAYAASGYGASAPGGTGSYPANGYDGAAAGNAYQPAGTGQAPGYQDGEAAAYQNGAPYANGSGGYANGGAQPNGNGYAGASPYGSAPQPTFTPTFTPATPGYQNGGGYPANGGGYSDAAGYAGEQSYADNGYASGYGDGQQAAYQGGPTFTPAGPAEPAQGGYWDGDPQAYDPQNGRDPRDPREQRYPQRR
jgi:hypothetical protein